MSQKTQNWLQKPNVAWGWSLIAVITCTCLLYWFDHTQLSRDLENKISRPFDFRAREKLNLSPQLNPRIKVFVIDDATVSWLKTDAPSIIQWADLIDNIAFDSITLMYNPVVDHSNAFGRILRPGDGLQFNHFIFQFLHCSYGC